MTQRSGAELLAALEAYERAIKRNDGHGTAMDAALTAAKAVREQQEAARRKDEEKEAVRLLITAAIAPWLLKDRRPSAPDAARPPKTSKYVETTLAMREYPQPAPERRCGTCRWWPDAGAYFRPCGWITDKMPWPLRHGTAEDAGTDCPTWEARS